jgi:flagellar basal-body rod modification protein FlgD
MTIASIDSLNSVASTTAKSSTSSLSSLDSEEFLKLLLVELENQDPTDPIDVKEMTQQFASLTQVEQNAETNDYLEELLQYSSSQAVNYLGKTITYDLSEADAHGNTEGTSVVTGISYTDGVPYLVTDQGEIALTSVTKVN